MFDNKFVDAAEVLLRAAGIVAYHEAAHDSNGVYVTHRVLLEDTEVVVCGLLTTPAEVGSDKRIRITLDFYVGPDEKRNAGARLGIVCGDYLPKDKTAKMSGAIKNHADTYGFEEAIYECSKRVHHEANK